MPRYILDYGPSATGTPVFTVYNNLNTGVAITAPVLSALVSGYTAFEVSGIIPIQFRAELGSLYISDSIDPRNYLPSGNGPIEVNHDYGGTNNLQIKEIDTDEPVENAFIYVYFKSDWDAGNRARGTYVIAYSVTDVLGHWINSVYLDPGDYTLYITHAGAAPVIQDLTVS